MLPWKHTTHKVLSLSNFFSLLSLDPKLSHRDFQNSLFPFIFFSGFIWSWSSSSSSFFLASWYCSRVGGAANSSLNSHKFSWLLNVFDISSSQWVFLLSFLLFTSSFPLLFADPCPWFGCYGCSVLAYENRAGSGRGKNSKIGLRWSSIWVSSGLSFFAAPRRSIFSIVLLFFPSLFPYFHLSLSILFLHAKTGQERAWLPLWPF